MSKRIEDLRLAVETMEHCKARHESSTPIRETFRGQTVWEGVVESFALAGHPKAKRCYAWSYEHKGGNSILHYAGNSTRRITHNGGEGGDCLAEEMSRRKQIKLGFGFVALLGLLSAQAQGTFQNLNFESANLSPIVSGQYGGEVAIGSALPGWSATIGGVAVTQVLQNNYTLGAASIDIFGPNWNETEPGIIDGNYTVFLQAFNTEQGNVSIWQTGTIPANAASLQFSAWSYLGDTASLSVSFAGNSLSPVILGSGQSSAGQSYTVYGVNIAAYAGQSGQLEFTSLAGGPDWNELDDINFSPNTIPEPGTLALVVMGGSLFGAYHLFSRRSAR